LFQMRTSSRLCQSVLSTPVARPCNRHLEPVHIGVCERMLASRARAAANGQRPTAGHLRVQTPRQPRRAGAPRQHVRHARTCEGSWTARAACAWSRARANSQLGERIRDGHQLRNPAKSNDCMLHNVHAQTTTSRLIQLCESPTTFMSEVTCDGNSVPHRHHRVTSELMDTGSAATSTTTMDRAPRRTTPPAGRSLDLRRPRTTTRTWRNNEHHRALEREHTRVYAYMACLERGR